MRMQMCRVGNIDFELMESIDDRNVIGRFLKSESQDCITCFRSPRYFPGNRLDEEERYPGDHRSPNRTENLLAIFLHPRSFHGVMFELIQGYTVGWEKKICLYHSRGAAEEKRGLYFAGSQRLEWP